MLEVLRYDEGVEEPESLTLDKARPYTGDSPVWVDCTEPTDEELSSIGKTFGLHEFVLKDLRHAGQRALPMYAYFKRKKWL